MERFYTHFANGQQTQSSTHHGQQSHQIDDSRSDSELANFGIKLILEEFHK